MNFALIVATFSLALTIVLFFYFRWFMEHRSAADELLADYRKEVQKLEAEIDFITDRDLQLIEARIKQLNEMLNDTDRRIAVYVKELERARLTEAVYAKLEQNQSILLADKIDVLPENPEPKTQSETVKPAQPVISPLSEPVSEEEIPPKISGKSRSKPEEKQDKRVRIANLAMQGFDTIQIASKLKISVSEVELTLNLLKK